MAFCANCGTQADDNAKFCPSCGQAMNAAPPPPPPPPADYQAPPPQYPPQQDYQQTPPQPYPPPPPPPGYQQPPQYPPPPYQQGYQQGYQQPGYQQPGYQPHPQSDAEANKVMAILSYLGILCLVPLLMGKHKESPFAKFHLNQGVMLAIIYVGYSVINAILSAATATYVWGVRISGPPIWLSTILWLIAVPIGILSVIGIINSVKGETKPLPVIGNWYTFFK